MAGAEPGNEGIDVANDTATAQVRLGTPTARWILLAAILGSGLAGIDATVVNVALPAIGRDLHAGFDGLQWTITGYTLTLASFILLGGSLGDRFGRRRVFVVGVAWFAIASAACAVAPNIGTLVAARAVQGIGGALLTPGSLAMISASFVPGDRAKAIGMWSGFGGIATAIGPFVGGYLIDGPGWRWIFIVNVPLAVLVVAISRRHVPETKDPDAVHGLDVAGALLGALGLGGLTYALIRLGSGFSALVCVTGAVGIAALAAFVMHERRGKHPMLPLSIFANRQFSATNAVTFVVYAALGGLFFLLSVELQVVSGFSPLLAGTALLPVTALMLVLSPRAAALSDRTGPRWPMTFGPLIAAAGIVLLAMSAGRHATYVASVLPGVIVFGLGLSLLVAPLTTTVLAAAPNRYAGIASGVNNAVARAASLLAVAVLPVAAGIVGNDYRNGEHFLHGYRIALMLCTGLLIVGGLGSALLIRNPSAPPAPAPHPEHHYDCAVCGPPVEQAAEAG
jgi:EmrB/QacA subfamily drug resistance transporter